MPTYLVRGPEDIDPKTLEGVRTACLTAGASSPPYLIDGVMKRLKTLGVKSEETRTIADEDFRWKLPRPIQAEIDKRKKMGQPIEIVSVRHRHTSDDDDASSRKQ